MKIVTEFVITHRNGKFCWKGGGGITIGEDGIGDLEFVGVVSPNVGEIIAIYWIIECGVVDWREFDEIVNLIKETSTIDLFIVSLALHCCFF